MSRPVPPPHLHGVEAIYTTPIFEPARDLLEWATSTFLDEDSDLHNPDHAHLAVARLGMLWTNTPNVRQGRAIVGQCEYQPPGGTMGKWVRGRAQMQLHDWFGQEIDFLLTFDAGYAAQCGDAEFCSLVEHELYHAGQERDIFGLPKFTKAGFPCFCLRGHDIEQFVGVVARYGADAAQVRALAEAAAKAPELPEGRIKVACGNCG